MVLVLLLLYWQMSKQTDSSHPPMHMQIVTSEFCLSGKIVNYTAEFRKMSVNKVFDYFHVTFNNVKAKYFFNSKERKINGTKWDETYLENGFDDFHLVLCFFGAFSIHL